MTLTHFLSVLRARAGLALLVVLVTVAAAVGVGAQLPERYRASTTLMIDTGAADPVTGAWMGRSPTLLATQADVIRSERVAQDVVQRLALDREPAFVEAWERATQRQGRIEPWLAQTVVKMLDVEPARDSDIIAVTVTAADPGLAARIANATAGAYLDTSIALRADPARQTSAFFETQAREAREQLERAQARLSAFQQARGVYVGDDRLDIEAARLNELSSQLTALQAAVAESSSRQQLAQGASADRLQEVLASPLLGALRTDLTRTESRLQELGARLGERHPQVLETQAQVDLLRSRLDAETRRVAAGAGVSNTINRQREAELRRALDAQRERVAQIRGARDQGQVLLREVESAQRAYDGLLTRLNQAGLESRAGFARAHVLAEAVPPLQPVSPGLRVHAVLGLGAGVLLALGAVLLLEWGDPRLRSAGASATLVGLPLLGVLPRPDLGTRHAARKVPLVGATSMRRLAPPARPSAAGR